MKKICRINMRSLDVTFESAPPDYAHLGGRGLTSRIVASEVPPNCDALDKENKIVIAPGLLTGTKAPSSGRLSIGGKSPLTGGIKESNVGGNMGLMLARLGYKAIVIEDQPMTDEPYIIEISKHNIGFKPATALKYQTNYNVGQYIQKQYGEKTNYLCIGPVGEQQMPIASIASGDPHGRPTRHAGRGGLGAVLGSKGIKAIVALNVDVNGVDPQTELFEEARKKFARALAKEKKSLTSYGTAVLVNIINHFGGLPINNFRGSRLEDSSVISGEKLAENCKRRGGKTGHACHKGCVIRCSNIYHDENGQYLTSALEYETIGLLGSNCGLLDLDKIAELDSICDDYGIDTMEMGNTLAVSMEGKLLEFGDFSGMKALIDEIRQGTITGRLLGQGSYVTGKTLGVRRIPAVKGQSLSAYDPRVMQGTGVTYATSTMGADHTAGNCLPGRTGLNDRSGEGQVPAARRIQILSALTDNLGFCLFIGPVPENLEIMTILINAFLGRNYTQEEILQIGEEIIREEMKFNEKAGITRHQNDVPRFFRTEKIHDEFTFDVDQSELTNIY